MTNEWMNWFFGDFTNTCILNHRARFRLFPRWRSDRWWRKHDHPEVVEPR